MRKKTEERKAVEAEVLARGKISDSLDDEFDADIENILHEWRAADGTEKDLRMLAYVAYSGGWAGGIAYERRGG